MLNFLEVYYGYFFSSFNIGVDPCLRFKSYSSCLKMNSFCKLELTTYRELNYPSFCFSIIWELSYCACICFIFSFIYYSWSIAFSCFCSKYCLYSISFSFLLLFDSSSCSLCLAICSSFCFWSNSSSCFYLLCLLVLVSASEFGNSYPDLGLREGALIKGIMSLGECNLRKSFEISYLRSSLLEDPISPGGLTI